MGYSSLVSYKKISPFTYGKRNGNAKGITIHHMAGNLTVERCGDIFSRAGRNASSNYGIGTDGRIALYLDESYCACTSSNRANDCKNITIEVANNSGAPNWTISDKAYKSLIALCVDICQRNGIKSLNWTGNANGNLTAHYMFNATACPGYYLKSKMATIAQTVTSQLSGGVTPIPVTPSKYPDTKLYKGGSLYYGQIYYDPLFDPVYYANNNPDVVKVYGNSSKSLFNHFLTYGMNDRRKPSAWFDVNVYKANNADLVKNFGGTWPAYYQHFCKYGKDENRKCI